MRIIRFSIPLAMLAVLVASACAVATPTSTPTPSATATPTQAPGGGTRPVAIGREFTLNAYEAVEVATAYFVLSFEVMQDSRCPKDVVCVWAGEATVALHLASPDGQRETQTLTIGPEGSATAQFDRHQITISDLQPYPVSTTQIDPKEYELTVMVR